MKYAIVAVDYYTKWVEAEPMNTITSKKALDFVINHIVCRYELPYKIVSENGKQFDSIHFTDICERHNIIKSFSEVARPQENGKTEAVNNIFKGTLRKKLQACKNK